MDPDDLAFAGPLRLRALLDSGSVRARDLVDLHLDRIGRLNPRLNAFISVRADEARDEADAAQRRLDAGERAPLLGIPFAVKEEQDLAGYVTGHGIGGRTEVAQADGPLVAALRGAGAIPLGQTAMPELGMHPFTESVTWGITRNPWDLGRTPGGSSGGSAAAVAAGLVPFATAGDGGGSIRIPASFCNLFGLKVQRGRLPGGSHVDPRYDISVPGVLTRGVADAAYLYDALAPSAWNRPLAISARAGPGRRRIGVTFRLGTPARVHPEVRAAVDRVADALRSIGHEVMPVRSRPGNWGVPFSIVGLRTLAGQAEVVEDPSKLEPRTRSAIRMTGVVSGPMLRWAMSRQAVITAAANAVFDDVDLVMTPTLTWTPPRAGQWEGNSLLRTELGVTRLCPFTSLWNFIGQPAVNVPAGFTARGLPVGVQLLGPADSEPLLIALSAQLEEKLRWTDPRPSLR